MTFRIFSCDTLHQTHQLKSVMQMLKSLEDCNLKNKDSFNEVRLQLEPFQLDFI